MCFIIIYVTFEHVFLTNQLEHTDIPEIVSQSQSNCCELQVTASANTSMAASLDTSPACPLKLHQKLMTAASSRQKSTSTVIPGGEYHQSALPVKRRGLSSTNVSTDAALEPAPKRPSPSPKHASTSRTVRMSQRTVFPGAARELTLKRPSLSPKHVFAVRTVRISQRTVFPGASRESALNRPSLSPKHASPGITVNTEDEGLYEDHNVVGLSGDQKADEDDGLYEDHNFVGLSGDQEDDEDEGLYEDHNVVGLSGDRKDDEDEGLYLDQNVVGLGISGGQNVYVDQNVVGLGLSGGQNVNADQNSI